MCSSRGIYGDTNKNEASNPPKYVGLETLKKRLTFEGGIAAYAAGFYETFGSSGIPVGKKCRFPL